MTSIRVEVESSRRPGAMLVELRIIKLMMIVVKPDKIHPGPGSDWTLYAYIWHRNYDI